MSKKYDLLVFIGRFQPFHIGHYSVLKKALELSKQVTIAVGSSYRPRMAKNPFTFQERKAFINLSLTEEEQLRTSIVPIEDFLYDDARWMKGVQDTVERSIRLPWQDKSYKIGIIGHTKDDTSYYLRMFPHWEAVEVDVTYPVNATDIRENFYEFRTLDGLKDFLVTEEAEQAITSTFSSTELETVRQEYDMLKKYKEAWKDSPFPPTFVTVDAVVVQSGHVLMIKRGAMPGKGQWALPGGFINEYELLEDAALRELIEETKIGVRYPKLKGSITKRVVFDSPHRSQRGRTITHAFLIELPNETTLPKVKGSDDAAQAKWIPFADLTKKREVIYEDHYDMIAHFLGV